MKSTFILLAVFIFLSPVLTANNFDKDILKTSNGDLTITFIAHDTLMIEFDGKVIHIDPVLLYADYATLPKADLILITHDHGDHLTCVIHEKTEKQPNYQFNNTMSLFE